MVYDVAGPFILSCILKEIVIHFVTNHESTINRHILYYTVYYYGDNTFISKWAVSS